MNNLDELFTEELINKRREYFSERKKFFSNNPEEQEKFIMKKGESDSSSLSNPLKHSEKIFNDNRKNNAYSLYKSSENKLFIIFNKEKTNYSPSNTDLDKYFKIEFNKNIKLYFDTILLQPMYLVISKPDKKFRISTASLRKLVKFYMEITIDEKHVSAIMNFTFLVHKTNPMDYKLDQEVRNTYNLPSLHHNAVMASS